MNYVPLVAHDAGAATLGFAGAGRLAALARAAFADLSRVGPWLRGLHATNVLVLPDHEFEVEAIDQTCTELGEHREAVAALRLGAIDRLMRQEEHVVRRELQRSCAEVGVTATHGFGHVVCHVPAPPCC